MPKTGKLFNNYEVLIDDRAIDAGGFCQNNRNGRLEANDIKTINFFYSRLKKIKNPVFLDIGANVGSFSLLPKVNNNISVYSFEPNPEIFAILNKNIELNNIKDNVKTFQTALSDKKGDATLRIPLLKKESGFASMGESIPCGNYSETKIIVDTLDNLADEFGIKSADLIKIDTEGHEFFILKGGERFIRRNMPDILLEYSKTYQFRYRPEEINNMLSGWGYDFVTLNRDDRYFFSKKSFPIPFKNRINHLMVEGWVMLGTLYRNCKGVFGRFLEE